MCDEQLPFAARMARSLSGQPRADRVAPFGAAALRFGGFDDWRLPTEEELRDLGRMPPVERTALMPNTAKGLYWSKVPGTDVEKALAVDLPAGTVSREDKRTACYVRAVRQPK